MPTHYEQPVTSVENFPITPTEMEKIVNDVSNLIRNMQGGYSRDMEDYYRDLLLDEISLRGVDRKSAAAQFLSEQGLTSLAGGRQPRTQVTRETFGALSPTGQAGFASRYGAPKHPGVMDTVAEGVGSAYDWIKGLLSGER